MLRNNFRLIQKTRISRLVKNRLINTLANPSPPTVAEAIVIGGGSLGCSTLYHLAKLGVKNSILLERHKLTSGTTWHTAGLFWRIRPNDIEIELLDYGRKLLTKILPEESGMESAFINNGGLFIASTKNRLEEYKRIMTLGKAYGIKSFLLGPSETKKLYPLMNVQDVYGSLYSPDDGQIDPSTWCTSLAQAARHMGALVFEDCPVKSIETNKDQYGNEKVYAVQLDDGCIVKSDTVIVCAGAWAPELVKPLGIYLPTLALHHTYVITETIEGARKMPNVRDHDSAIYIRTTGDSLAFGGYEKEATYWENITHDFRFGLFDMDWTKFFIHSQAACHRVPALGQAGIKSTICGPMSFTPDHRPLMGECPQIKGPVV